MADKVATEKKDKISPVLKELLVEASKLSDTDYNSMMALAKTFMKVTKKHSGINDKQHRPSNPLRGKYGGSRK